MVSSGGDKGVITTNTLGVKGKKKKTHSGSVFSVPEVDRKGTEARIC